MAFVALSEQEQKQKREAFISELNKLVELAKTWTKAIDCNDAYDLLIEIYDSIGWFDPGKKADKRKKQEAKRRSKIEEIRKRT